MTLREMTKGKKDKNFLSIREPLQIFQRDLNSLFEDFFHGGGLDFSSDFHFAPQMDVSETEKDIIVKADVPGVEEGDLDISLSNDLLTVKGEKKLEKEEKDKNFYRMERSYGSFQRCIQLPAKVMEDKVEASFKNGVLTITLPKSKEAEKNVKKIEVKKS